MQNSINLTELANAPLRLKVDSEHVGIRTLMPILGAIGLIGGFILGGLIARQIDESLSTSCVGAVTAIIGVAVMLQLGDKVIKRLWTSGRELQIEHHALRLINRKEQVEMQWSQGLGIQAWFFEVPTRRARVPKGWYCTSVRLTQNDEKIILYSFLSPEHAQSLHYFNEWFIHLRNKKEREAMGQQDARWLTQQERFRRLEGDRWFTGAELAPEDFLGVMELVYEHGQLAPFTD